MNKQIEVQNRQRKRPELNKSISPDDFTAFYWLKEELTEFCRAVRIRASGSKNELSARILKFLESGKTSESTSYRKIRPTSEFDWNHEVLTPETLLTDNYRNTENVRRFFKSYIGPHFRFTVTFMNWIKQNSGKSLKQAQTQWINLQKLKKNQSFKTEIAPQFEYNRFIRDFLADNPGLTLKEAIEHWKITKNEPGSNQYSRR